ncbi:MAG: RidA family protein [Crocinitomicaceae bacterium]|nr:RidA family protein [Crocinitomicaceae bacterium]
MGKEIITIKGAPAPIGPYSQGVKINGMLFLSGQIAIDPQTGELNTGNVESQTHRVMQNIQALLKEAGMNWENVIKASIFISDMNNFAQINEVYASYFSSDFPARETVEVSRLPKDVDVEISIIASEL